MQGHEEQKDGTKGHKGAQRNAIYYFTHSLEVGALMM